MKIGDIVQIVCAGDNWPKGSPRFNNGPLFQYNTHLMPQENHHLWQNKFFTIVAIDNNLAQIRNESNEFVVYLTGLKCVDSPLQKMPSLQELL